MNIKERPKRIAVICGDITAALNRRPELMNEFVRLSQERPLFVCPAAEQKHVDAIEAVGFDCTIIENNKQSLNPLSGFGYYRKLYRFLQQHKPDEVFVFHLLPIIAVARACRKLGIRCHCLFAGLGYVFSGEASLKRKVAEAVTTRLMKSSLRDATTVFFQNPDDHKTITSRGILSSRSNVVVVNGSGVSLTEFPHQPPATDGPVVFLLVSRILRDKGIPEYYEAAKRLREKWGDQVSVQLLGPFDNNPNAMTRELIDNWHKEGTIEYLGVTEDVRPYLKRMSVFVLPSFYMEGTPKTILESLGTGRAIITTTSRGCRETVVDGENGFLIEPRNVDALFKAMDYFLENRQAIESMGNASRQMACDKYDVAKVNRKMLEDMNMIGNGESV